MSLTNGTRLLPQTGNAGSALSASYQLVGGQDYYCSVQAVDTSFAGSPFAAGAVTGDEAARGTGGAGGAGPAVSAAAAVTEQEAGRVAPVATGSFRIGAN